MSKLLITGGSGFIGTNYIINNEYFNNYEIINIDIKKPKLESQNKYLIKCDILHISDLENIIIKFKPDYILHLAAETDVNGKNLAFYNANIAGVENIVKVVKKVNFVKRVIFTSTQHVHQFHGQPTNDDEYFPLGLYGESKVIGEKIVKKANLECEWLIIRPTNIWGPYHNIYPEGLWKQITKGRYLHPGNSIILRSYWYIGNVIYQINKLFDAQKKVVEGKIFYVGDLLSSISIDFPMNSKRFKNMILPNPCNIQKTLDVTGVNPYPIDESIQLTANWYLNEYLRK